jgi:hypothetical protein
VLIPEKRIIFKGDLYKSYWGLKLHGISSREEKISNFKNENEEGTLYDIFFGLINLQLHLAIAYIT